MKEFLDRSPENNPIRILAWARYLFISHIRENQEEELAQTLQLLQAAEKLGDPSLEAFVNYIVYWVRSNLEELSLKALQRAQDLFSQSNDIWWLGRILMHRGQLATQRSGNMALGLTFYKQALEANRKCGDERGIALGLSELAEYQIYAAELQAAEHLARESVEIHLRVGSTGVSYWAYFMLSDALLLQGKYKQALDVLSESRDLADRIGILRPECLLRIGNVFLCQGEFSKGLEHFAQITPTSRPKPELDDLAWKHLYLAVAYTHLGQLAEAEQALESARLYGVQGGSFYSTVKLAEAETLFYLASGNLQNAQKPVQDLITLCQRNQNFSVLTVALEFQAWAFYLADRPAKSARLFAATSAFRAQKAMPMLDKDKLLYEPVIASLQSQLGEEGYHAAWEEGHAMSVDQAIQTSVEVNYG